jgi:uncharacterized phosphosugar-binding protein
LSALLYFEKIFEILKEIKDTQMEHIQKAAILIADTIVNDGIVHVFGTGHSHMLAEEVFLRAGGLAAVNAILEPNFMLHTGALKSSLMEKMEGYASIIFKYYDIRPEDILIILSNSGVNTVPVEMALRAQQRGVKVIAITSLSYSKAAKSKHQSGKKVYQIADIVLDNKGAVGDAILNIDGLKQSIGPTSTIAGALILNGLFAQVVKNLVERGIDPPIFISSKLKGADEHNGRLIKKYKERIKCF